MNWSIWSTSSRNRLVTWFLMLLAAFGLTTQAAPVGKLISAANRYDFVHDGPRNILYISEGPRILRYDLGIEGFRQSIEVGGNLRGLDLSPDGNFLAVADANQSSTQCWIHVVDLRDGSIRKLDFPSEPGGGTFSLAYGQDGTLLVCGNFAGGFTPRVRRVDPGTGAASVVNGLSDFAVLSASGDRRIIAAAFIGGSNGQVSLYDVVTRSATASTAVGWFNYAVATSKDGSQTAVPVYGGTFVYDGTLQPVTKIGTYAGESPVGAAYHPTRDAVFFAWAGTSEVRAHNTTSFEVLGSFEVNGRFEHPGNVPFQSGHLKLSSDGTRVFVAVPGGVSWFAHGLELPVYHRLQIAGNPVPVGAPMPLGYGTNFVAAETRVTNRVTSPAEANGTRYKVKGWTRTGSPEIYPGETAVLTMSNAYTLTWLWEPTHRLLTPSIAGGGAVDDVGGWYAEGTAATITAQPSAGWKFARWTGEVPAGQVTENPLVLRMEQPRRITAVFQPLDGTSGLVGDWPTFGREPAHSGYFPGALGTNRFHLRWSTPLSAPANQLAVADGRVFVTPLIRFEDAEVLALSAGSGRKLWARSFPPAPNSINPPTFANGSVFFQRGNHGSDSQLYRLNAETGETEWRQPFAAQWERYLAPVVADGRVWMNAGYYGGLYGFEAGNGQLLFFRGLAQSDEWTPAYWQGRLFSFVEGTFIEHHPATGDTLWSVSLGWNWGGGSMRRTVAISEGVAFVVNSSDLVAIDLTRRAVLWRVPGNFSGTPAVASGLVYVNEGGSQVTSFTAAAGDRIRSFEVSLAHNQPLLTADVLIASSPLETVVFDRFTGDVRQRLPVGGTPSLADGVLFLAAPDNRVEAWASGEDQTLIVQTDGIQVGTPEPFGYGTNRVPTGTHFTNSVSAVVELVGQRFRSRGYTLSGAVTGQGTGNSVSLQVTGTTTLTWHWELTDFQLLAVAAGKGSVSLTNDWFASGSTATVTATPGTGMKFLRWDGDVPVAARESNPLSLTMDQPRRVNALFQRVDGTGGVNEWTTLGNGPGHTGYVPGLLGGRTFHRRWANSLGGSLQQVAVGGNRVFVIPGVRFQQANVIALGEFSGEQLWTGSFPPDPNNMSPPTFTDGGLFFQRSNHGNDSQVYRLDPVTGAVVWRSPYSTQWSQQLAPVVAAGKVWVQGGYYGGLYGYHAAGGAELFFQQLPQIDGWTPAYADGAVFTVVGSILRAHAPDTGKELWQLNLAAAGLQISTTPVAGEGLILLANANRLAAVSIAGRSVVWQATGGFRGLPSLAGGVVYIRENTGVAAFAATSGQRVATFDGAASNEAGYSQPIVTDDSLILADESRTLVIDLFTRAIRQTLDAGGQPSLAGDTLYLASAGGVLQSWSPADDVLLVVQADGPRVGRPFPFTYGSNFVPANSEVEAQARSTAGDLPGVRVTARGWTGTGDVPATGTGNSVKFRLTRESQITWQWNHEYLLQSTVQGEGTVNIRSNWFAGSSVVQLTATPAPWWQLADWSDGTQVRPAGPLSVTMTNALFITARFTAETVTNNVPKWWLARNNLPTTDAGALGDPDNDGLPNWREFELGADPHVADRDLDGFVDGLEIAYGSNPDDPNSTPVAQFAVTYSINAELASLVQTQGLPLFSTNVVMVYPEPLGGRGTRYSLSGWSSKGLNPASGNSSPATVMILTNATLNWNWVSEHELETRLHYVQNELSRTSAPAATLRRSRAEAEDWFGHNVAVDGDLAVIGAPLAATNPAARMVGLATVFTRIGDRWETLAELAPPSVSPAVGGHAALKSVVQPGRITLAMERSGSLFLQAFNGTNGQWLGTNPRMVDELHSPLADLGLVVLETNRLVLGSPDGTSEATGGFVTSGRVHLLTYQDGWRGSQTVAPRPARNGMKFGAAIAADGKDVLVGAPGDEPEPGRLTGSAQLLRFENGRLTPGQFLAPTNVAQFARFGAAVAVHDDLAAVGAPDDEGGGSVHLYQNTGVTWTLVARLSPPAAGWWQEFGATLAIQNQTLLVGAPGGDGGMLASGVVYRYSKKNGAWTLDGELHSEQPTLGGRFGSALAWSGSTVVVGAPGEPSGGPDGGTAYTFLFGEGIESVGATWHSFGSVATSAEVPEFLERGGSLFRLAGWTLDGTPVSAPPTPAPQKWSNIPMSAPHVAIAQFERVGDLGVDADADDLPDLWETTVLGSLAFNGDDDNDQDGQNNRAERIAGTSPVNSASVFHLTLLNGTPPQPALVWNATPGRRYRVWTAPSLNAPWQVLHPSMSAGPDGCRLPLSTDAAAGAMYRVEIIEP